MTKVMKFIGIDISKSSFDVCRLFDDGTESCEHYAFDGSSVSKFVKTVDAGALCVMEATGTYHLRLAYALCESGRRVSVVNPLSVKRFSQMRMSRTKTDRKDARLLCDYARMNREELPLFEPSSDSIAEARQLMTLLDQLQRQDTMLLNQEEAVSVAVVRSRTALAVLRKQRKLLAEDMKRIESKIEELINEDNHDDYERLQTIPGIGKKSAAALIVTTDAMKKFQNYRQLCSYFGLCPRVYESGTSVKGKAHICKMGMARIRRLLYLAALSASRCNDNCRALFERMVAAGKPKMVALVAVAHKLMKIAFALCKNKTQFIPDFNSFSLAF